MFGVKDIRNYYLHIGVIYRVTHKGCDLRDETSFYQIYSVLLHSGFPVVVKLFLCLPDYLFNLRKTFFKTED